MHSGSDSEIIERVSRPRNPPHLAPTAADAARAAARIYQRRLEAGDGRLERFPDTGDLFGVLGFVHQNQAQRPEDLAEDALGELTILRFLRAELERRLRLAILRARKGGVEWADLAEPIGVTSAQGAQQTLARLESVCVHEDARSEKAEIERRRAVDARARAASVVAEGVLRGLAAALKTHRAALPDSLAEDIDALLTEVGRRRFGDASLARARLLCDELDELSLVPQQLRAAMDELRTALPRR